MRLANNRVSISTNRRKFLTGIAATSALGVAGCIGDDEDTDPEADEIDPGFAQPEEPDEYRPVQTLRYWGETEASSPDKRLLQDLAYETFTNELGMDINYEVMAHSEMGDRALAQEFEMIGISWEGRAERMDPQVLLSLFDSAISDPGNPNIGAYQDEEYDAILEDIATTVDYEERREHVFAAQEKLHHDQPCIFVYHPHRLNAIDNRNWSNHTARQVDHPYWNVGALSELQPTTDDRTFIVGSLDDITHFNPMEWTSTAEARNQILNWDPLVRFGLDGQAQGSAATDWEVVDELTVEVELREGMVFHDGEPVTAEDVKFTYDYHMQWETEKIARFYERIDSVEVLDDHRVRFNYERPDSGFIVAFNQIWILPKHVWDGVIDEFDADQPRSLHVPNDVPATGSGPFKMLQTSPDDRTIYEVFDDYYVDFEVDQLIWNHFGSSSSLFGALETGEVHHVAGLEPGDFERAETNDDLNAESTRTIGFTPIHTHTQHEPTNDVNVRQAMAHAIDYNEIIAVATRGNADVSTSPIAPANEDWHNHNLEPYTGGPAKARRVLYDAGYRWNEDQQLLMPID